MFDYLRALTIRQLQALSDQTRLIVAHPNYTQQRTIMSKLVHEDAVIYVRFDGNNLSLNHLQHQLEVAVVDQSDYHSLDGKILVLDECDRAEAEAMDNFLSKLLLQSSLKRIVVFGREAPQCILNNQALRNHASFVPHDSSLMLWDYPQRSEKTVLLEVRAFGEGHTLLEGRCVDDNWDGLLPAHCFFTWSIEAWRRATTFSRHFGLAKTTAEATNIFHVTKRKINEVLGIDLMVYWSGFYRISPKIHLSYDAVLFTEMSQQSAVVPFEEATDFLTRAIAIYQGVFLSSLDIAWVQKRRGELNEVYGESLAALAHAKEISGDSKTALGLYLRAATTNYHCEDFVHNIMRLYQEQNRFVDALIVYDRFVEKLRSDLGLSPSAQIQELADRIREKEFSSTRA